MGWIRRKLRAHLQGIGELREGVTYTIVKLSRPIRCVVPMHAFGHPVLINELCGGRERVRA